MNAFLVDSSVILDIFTADRVFYRASLELLSRCGAVGELCINDIIYAEISAGFERIETLEEALSGCGIVSLTVPKEALFLAAKAFVAYRRRGGSETTTLPDFFIGAHAAVSGMPLLTRDPERVRASFPSVRLLEPGG